MGKKIKLLGVLLCMVCFIAGCGCSGGDVIVGKETKRKPSTGESWTVMIYMSTSTPEDKYSRAGDVLKSLSYDLPENINVIVEVGGCKDGWSIEGIKDDNLQDFAVQKNGIRLIGESKLKNMGNKDTYASFIARTVKKYPADRYVSVIWGDGGNFIYGVAHDSLSGYDSLTPKEIAEALDKADTKLDIIGFDAGMMADINTASTLAPCADFMIASEDIMPFSGWDYREFFKLISETPSATSVSVGEVICDGILKNATKEYEEQVCVSLIDLSQIDALTEEFDILAGDMVSACEDMDRLQAMTAMINLAPSMGANSAWEGYTNLVDLADFTEAVSSAARVDRIKMEKAIEAAVAYKATGDFHADSCGLSVFYPKNRNSQEINAYKKVCDSQNYKEYIDKSTANRAVTDRTADYKETAAWQTYSGVADDILISAEPDLNGKYMLSVSNADTIVKIGVNLYKYDEEEGLYVHLNTDDDIYYSNITNTYENELRSKQLEMNGIPVDAYRITTIGNKSIYSIPVIYEDVVSALRVLKTSDSSKEKAEYKVLGIWEGQDSKNGIIGRKYKIPASGDTITPIYSVYGGNSGKHVEGKSLTLVFGGLTVKEKNLDDGEYLLSYTVEDIYGKVSESNTSNVTAIKGKMQISK